jgi:hypothetical protein
MLENAWMLLASWLFFGYLSGHVYSKKMIFKLFMKYQTHHEVIANKQAFWFQSGYWQVNTMLHHATIMFLSLFTYSVIATIFGFSPNVGWYVAYIALFVAIKMRADGIEKDYKNSCIRIDALLDVSGYSVNISQFKTDVTKPRIVRKMNKVETPSPDINDQSTSRRTT